MKCGMIVAVIEQFFTERTGGIYGIFRHIVSAGLSEKPESVRMPGKITEKITDHEKEKST
ncbi:MAG: hypothetical protein K6C08_00660 [Oscillospiraceae bacterium]|nr:hypothetical protein [Oscillospiraceae bacterium]